MYFAKNEVIEIDGNRRFLVVDTAFIDDMAYYKIKEIDENNNIIGVSRYITANNDEGKLYLNEDLTKTELDKLKEIIGD